jgi:adenylate cyclase
MPDTSPMRATFGPFELDRAERLLLRDGQPATLPRKAFDVLALLVARAGHLVTKDELLDAVWPGVVVEENVLSVTVSRMRAVLGEDGRDFVRAVPGYGYRFVAPVKHVVPAADGYGRDSEETDYGPRLEDVVLAPGGGDGMARAGPAAATLADVRALGVAPFRAHDAAATPIAVGLADALVAALARLGVAAHAGAGPVMLGGEVQVAGGRARASVRVNGEGRALWVRTFTASDTDPLTAQDSLAAAAAEALSLRLAAAARIRSGEGAGTEVPASYFRARYLIERRMEGRAAEALAEFEAAAEASPDFAPAWTGIAEVCVLLPYLAGTPPREAFPRARSAAERALALDPGNVEALLPLAHVAWRYDWDAAEGQRLLREALDQCPDLAPAHQTLGLLLVLGGRTDEGLAHLARAQELLPDAIETTMEFGFACYFAGRYDEALRHLHAVLDLAPGFPMAQLFVGLVRDAQGDPAGGLADAEAAVRTGGPHPVFLATVARAYARCGRLDDARAVLADVDRAAAAMFVSPFILAPALDALGDREAALVALERAADVRDPMLAHLGTHPHLDPLRAEPRFRALALRIGAGLGTPLASA